MPMIAIRQAKRKGKYYQIILSNSVIQRFSEEMVLQYNIFPGRSFSEIEWRKILHESFAHECYQKALKLLSVKPYTEKQIQYKLERQFTKSTVAATLAKAKGLKLVDDTNYVRQYVGQERTRARLGTRRIVANLRRRGIPLALINDVVSEIDREQNDQTTDYCNALKVGEKKWRLLSKSDDKVKRKMKLFRFLASRGFSSEVCHRVSKQVTLDHDLLE